MTRLLPLLLAAAALLSASDAPVFPYGAVYFRKSNPPEAEWARDHQTAARIGMNTFRHWFMWSAIEVAPGKYDWRDYDRMMDLAAQNGIKVVIAELITAAPSDHGVTAAGRAKRRRDVPQHFVARGVTVGVVDQLESVHVEHDYGHVAGHIGSDDLLHSPMNCAMVHQTRKTIVIGLIRQLGLRHLEVVDACLKLTHEAKVFGP